MPGAAKAWAVDGTPADTVQLALSGALFEVWSPSKMLFASSRKTDLEKCAA